MTQDALGTTGTQPKARVLVADDDALFRETTVALLKNADYAADGVATADEALQRVNESPVDVLITDVDMPGAQGLGYLRPLVEDDADAPSVLIATAYPSINSARVAFQLAAVDYLPKPFARGELLEAVGRAVERRASRALLQEVEARVGNVHEELGQIRRRMQNGGPDDRRELPAPAPMARAFGAPRNDGPGGQPAPTLDLSPRESEIVELLRQGLRGSEIASTLDLSPNTIRNHFKSIFRKAGVHSQVGLLALFRNN